MRLVLVVGVVALALAGTENHGTAADPAREVAVAPAAPAAVPAAPAALPMIAGSRAAEYVGQDVTVEGRVTAIHESPLATVIGFSQNFAGFTASIMAADRDKFPTDLGGRLRDRVVRVSGTISTYRGKPEMTVRDPAQLVLAPAPGPGSVVAHPPPMAAATPDGSAEEIRRALARIEGRLDSMDARLRSIEQPAADPDDGDPVR